MEETVYFFFFRASASFLESLQRSNLVGCYWIFDGGEDGGEKGACKDIAQEFSHQDSDQYQQILNMGRNPAVHEETMNQGRETEDLLPGLLTGKNKYIRLRGFLTRFTQTLYFVPYSRFVLCFCGLEHRCVMQVNRKLSIINYFSPLENYVSGDGLRFAREPLIPSYSVPAMCNLNRYLQGPCEERE